MTRPKPTADELYDRPGFDTRFLAGTITPHLTASTQVASDLLVVRDGATVLPYEHFSLAMSVSRNMARWVAWNIHGSPADDKETIERLGFRQDPRVARTDQIPDAFYREPLNRGHIARRADLLWGDAAAAKRANDDSFYLTNITPQMDDFNQSAKKGLWGLLENDLLSRAHDNRISVLGGPIFHDDDAVLRGVKIPREFWKLFVYVLDGHARVKGWVLTQKLSHLEGGEIDLKEWDPYVVSLTELSSRTGLQLAGYAGAVEAPLQTGHHENGFVNRPPLTRLQDIAW
ncbi:hypothetical protein BH11ACT3_BH11ACT3_09600 [soil metagenome]